jgi:hypothetical protein
LDVDFSELDLRRHFADLRATWQARVLAGARDRMMIVVTSILAHSFDDAMWTLFNLAQPHCWDMNKQSLRCPFLTSIGKINRQGRIVAKVKLHDDGLLPSDGIMFANTRDFERELRKLADSVRLSDRERLEFFVVARKWVGSDMRLDPTMNPADPDAKRLVN